MAVKTITNTRNPKHMHSESLRIFAIITDFLSFLDTIAFHSALTSYSTIPNQSEVVFNEVLLNEGDG